MEDKNMVERQVFTPPPEGAIVETPEEVSYLGVRLPKAQNFEGHFVPRREQYVDYINDQFSLDLQKQIAVSFLQGDPLLIEGGTSIGKTTAVRKMAAELGWEVHYANLNGATDVEDLMGRYIPNPDKRNPGDPEYVFADGKVTSGLRQEEGKVKVIILDEFNSAAFMRFWTLLTEERR
jgi:MoxR-like ATPase